MSWARASPRPPLPSHASSSSEVPTPRSSLPPLLAEIEIFLIPAKVDIGALVGQIESLGGTLVSDPEDARIILTALKGRPRIAHVVGDELDDRWIVDVGFITEAYRRCVESIDGVPKLPKWEDYRLHFKRKEESQQSQASEASQSEPGAKRAHSVELLDGPPAKRTRLHDGEASPPKRSPKAPDKEDRSLEAMELRLEGVNNGAPDVALYPEDIRLRDIPRLACERPSPLTCPNQDIINAIKPIYLEREYDHLAQINTNVLSYRRSMAILKSVPRRIKSGAEAQKLIDVGDKVANRIDEYLQTGRIEESELILKSERYKALEEFASVYSIGHSTAAQLWHDGCRNLEDVKRYFQREEPEGKREERKARQRQMGGGMERAEIVDAWLKLREELDTKIPRDEVVEIADVVGESLDALCPGCEWTITGGYRRGKEAAGDVDIVFKPPREGMDIGLLGSLCRRLGRLGIVTHVLHVTARDVTQPLHSSGANFDNLDKAFVILKLPKKGALHRRVDLISAPVERYAAAVLSWSGSMMFERDLRRFIENKGYKFRAGLLDRNLQEINFETEREIFEFVDLPWVPPTLRNADG